MLRHTTRHLLEVAKTLETGFLLQLQASAVFHAHRRPLTLAPGRVSPALQCGSII
jgi:hypothetical protein